MRAPTPSNGRPANFTTIEHHGDLSVPGRSPLCYNEDMNMICKRPGCDRPVRKHPGAGRPALYCDEHILHNDRSGKPCSWAGCGDTSGKGGYCNAHHAEVMRNRARVRREALGYTANSRPPAHSTYIVADHELGIIKFGITNNTARRLATHARGTRDRPFHLDEVIAVREFLGEGEPKVWEDAIKADLKAAGITPHVGTEYFGGERYDEILTAARRHGMWTQGYELT